MNASKTSRPAPLEGVTVLDFTTALAGPYATLLLAGLGANVIKIENPQAPDSARGNSPFWGEAGLHSAKQSAQDMSVAILDRARNKRSVTLNLKQPGAHDVFRDLVALSDVIVENFSTGTADRMGIGYDVAREINPRIVFTSISGFGADASGRQNKAMDTIVQALSGLMFTSGRNGDDPVRVGVPFGDLSAPLFAVIGTIAALMQARVTGEGQRVDVSLLGSLTALVASEPFELLSQSGIEMRSGNLMPRLAPFGVFASIGGHVAICAPTNAFTAALFRAMDRPDLVDDARFTQRHGRVANNEDLHELVSQWTASHRVEDVIDKLEQAGVPCGLVRTPGEAVRDVRLLRRGETQRIVHPQYGDAQNIVSGGIPIVMSGSDVGLHRPAPALGQDNAEIFRDLLGYSQDKVDALAAQGAI